MKLLLAIAAFCTISMQAQPAVPTLWIIGDSTVRNGRGDGGNGQWGWGEPLAVYFDPEKIHVVNRALGGRSSRTYLTQGQWAKVLDEMKVGDFLLIQFGHNDGGPVNDKARARGTLRGTGDQSQEIDNELTGEHEIVHTFGWYLGKFIVDARAKGVSPIVCSMVPRKLWVDGKILRNKANYGGWAQKVAEGERVPFVDLNEIIAQRYEAMGPDDVAPLFADEHTHTTRKGAELNAECVIAGLKRLKDSPLAPYFSDLAKGVK